MRWCLYKLLLKKKALLLTNSSCWQDLSKLNRDPAKILYVSAHAFDSSLQPENSVPIKPYKLETDDTALLDLIPFLECKSYVVAFSSARRLCSNFMFPIFVLIIVPFVLICPQI